MAWQYHLKAFLREAPGELLGRYLGERGIGTEIDWGKPSAENAEAACEAISAAPTPLRREVECHFREVAGMADEGGVTALVEEGKHPYHNVDLAEPFHPMRGHLERAFWACLEYPRLFEVARRLHDARSLTRWRKRDHLPAIDPSTDRGSREALSVAISRYYREREGRGETCHIDHYAHGGRLYWFAYPEDYAVEQRVYTDDHRLEVQTHRPAFDVLSVYSTEERSLDTWVRGDRNLLTALQSLFASMVLGIDIGDPEPRQNIHELDGLLDRHFPFVLRPEDRVESVRVSRLRLRLVGDEDNKRITLEANTQESPDALYDLVGWVVANDRLQRDLLRVDSATLKLAFRPTEDDRGGTLSFDISRPDSCTLKYDPKDLVAKELLKRWGLDVSGRPDDDTARRRRNTPLTLRV
ncbi:MAG: hypothetical protein FJX74_12320 [Armatimonadetes bacterium]|nr:hypothetical protein [Armatimonadota bacterium]